MWEESTPQNAAKPGPASRENQFLKKLLMLNAPAPGSNKGGGERKEKLTPENRHFYLPYASHPQTPGSLWVLGPGPGVPCLV